jgi:excisionase family DNA binding protein
MGDLANLHHERLLSPSEAAMFLGTSVRHVRRLVSERRLGHVKVGRYVRFERQALESFIAARRVDAAGGRAR